jgi:hypothetical protein
MILPNQKHQTVLVSTSSSSSSSSSLESTLSDYSSDTVAEIIRNASRNLKSKSKPKQRPQKKPKISAPKEGVAEDTSFLDHLTPHLSGDAFTHSNLNSPSHPINKFLNVTAEPSQGPIVQEPPIISVQTPPPHSVAPEQNNPNIIITSEPETQPPQNDDIP